MLIMNMHNPAYSLPLDIYDLSFFGKIIAVITI